MTYTAAAQTTAPRYSLAWEDEIARAEAEAEAFDAENLQDPAGFLNPGDFAIGEDDSPEDVADENEWAESQFAAMREDFGPDLDPWGPNWN